MSVGCLVITVKMWLGQPKAVVTRIVLSRYLGGLPLILHRSVEVHSKRMSTCSSGAHHGDTSGKVLAEPDPEVLEILVCPFTKVGANRRTSLRIETNVLCGKYSRGNSYGCSLSFGVLENKWGIAVT